MKEYIIIPEYFEKELVDCKILNEFLNHAEYMDDLKIELDSLRKFYSKDSKEGLKLIDELKVRGFEFVSNSPNKMLYTFKNIDEIELLYTNKNDNKIVKINKKIFTFLDNNDIKSDFYFNLIPIYGFKNIMKDFNYELVKQEFIRYGYKVLSINEINRYIYKYKNSKEQLELRKDKMFKKGFTIPKIDYDIEINLIIKDIINKNPIYKERILNMKLDNILSERLSAEKSIKYRLIKDEIHTLNNLMNYDISRIKKIKGVGSKSILEFKKSIVNAIENIDKVDYEGFKINKLKDINLYIKYLIKENKNFEKVFKNIKLKEILPSRTKTDKLILEKFQADGVISIYDLLYYDIEKIKNINGVGVKKINEFIKRIQEELELVESKYKEVKEEVFFLEESKFEIVKGYEIHELDAILYGEKGRKYEELNHIYVKDLQGLKYNVFKDYNIIFYLKKLFIDLDDILDINKIIVKSKPQNISKRNKKILYERIVVGKTLGEIGNDLDLTRERVRQIEKNILDKYISELKNNNFLQSLKLNLGNKEFFYMKDFIDILDRKNYYITDIITSGNIDSLHYYEPLERVYFNSIDHIESDLKYILSEIPDYGEIEDDLGIILELLDDLLLNISYGEGIKILEENGISIKDSYYFKGDLSNKLMLEIIYRYAHKSKITLDDEGAKLINKYIKDIFDIEMDNNSRNWLGTTSTIEEVILIEPNTYIHIDHVPIETDAIEKLKEILERELSKSPDIYSGRLFDILNLEYPNSGIINRYHAYSLVKYYYSEYYQTSTGNSLKISKIGIPKLTNSEYVYDLCAKNGGIISLEKIKEITNWTHHVIEMAIRNSDRIIKLGSKKCAMVNTLFKEDERSLFKSMLSDDMREGYTTSNKFYYKLMFDNKMSSFLNRNKIEDGKELVGLMKYIDNSIEGHNIFMYYKNSNIRSVEEVIYNLYPIEVCRSDIYQILRELKIEYWDINGLTEKLLSSKKYVQISREEYINYNNFNIDESIKQKILLYFDKVYRKDGFIVPEKHITNIRLLSSRNEHSWNQYTIATILTQNGYKKLKRFNSDYRYEIIVLVKEEDKHEDISCLIYELIKYKYKGNLYEEYVYEFLSKKGIYKKENERYKKKLEMDAKRNGLLTVDVVGNVKLKE